MTFNLIISTPHALCNNIKTRNCDTLAKTAGQIFHEISNNIYLFKCIYAEGNINRINHDLNRQQSRNTTEFRKNLNNIIKNSNPLNTILIDIHSFSKIWLPEAGDVNFFKKDEVAPDIVLLSGKLDQVNNISLSKTLYKNISKCGFYCKIINNIDVLDILNNAYEYKIPGILIEFNEKFITDTKRLEHICKIITVTLYDICIGNISN